MASPTKRDAIPLYHQIFLDLRDEILSGRRACGAALPTEQDLGAQRGVSRITARRALDELAQHGLVERRRRIGTHVSFRAPTVPIEGHIDQAVESLIAFGRGTSVRVVAFDTITADDDLATRLARAPGSAILHALRIRSADTAPLGAIESFVPADLGVALDPTSLTRRPLLELIRSAGYSIETGSQVISATSADPALAALLETEARAAIIHIERVVRGADGRPLAYTSARYRGDRYRLSLDLHDAHQPIAAAISASE